MWNPGVACRWSRALIAALALVSVGVLPGCGIIVTEAALVFGLAGMGGDEEDDDPVPPPAPISHLPSPFDPEPDRSAIGSGP